MRPWCIPVLVGIAFIAGPGWAGDGARTVSPGDLLGVAVVEGRCPTFSWAAVEGARQHELVVYRLGEDGDPIDELIRQDLPASASSWTPSLDGCLERGGRYAWAVRAVGAESAADWSVPVYFAVASGPSELELEAALTVVREYLAARDRGPAPGLPAAAPSAEGAAEAAAEAARSGISTPAGGIVPLLSVEGPIAGDSFHTQSLVTGNLGIPGNAFVPWSENAGYTRWDGSADGRIAATDSNTFYGYAPVELPNGGVTVTNLTCYYSDRSDNTNAQIIARLLRRPLTSLEATVMAGVQVNTVGNIEAVSQYGTSTITDPVISNGQYHYYLEIQMLSNPLTEDLDFLIGHHGCRIRYTWDRLSN